MRKRIFTLLIAIILCLTPVLSACSNKSEDEEKAAKIYTLYTICEEGTTREAIKEVELALNRVMFNQLGVNIKLYMVPESEYDQLIEDTYKAIEEYEEAKKNKPKETSKDESSKPVEEVLTGEKVIANLEEGIEIELDRPRLDIFLVRGYDKYTKLVAEEKLAALDEKLSSEAKKIKDYIVSPFFTAAKVANPSGIRKTYGIPMNKGIGQYEYIVFDKEYLDKYQFDSATMKSLTDLENYLKIIKDNEPDIVPLANVFDSNNISYIFNDGFPAYINSNNAVINGYTDTKSTSMLDYFTMISRYYSLGYLIEDKPEKDFAVKFIRGTFEDLERLELESGREYESIIYAYPEPINEDLLENLFCVSKYCVTNDLTAVSEILEFLLTNSRPANLLTYGIENIHYSLDLNDQVVRINNDYINNPSNTGNAFITYTLAGENQNKWEILKKQNLDSNKNISPTIGFIYYPSEIKHPDNSEVLLEPDYSKIVLNALPEYYQELISGRAGYISPAEMQKKAEEEIKNDILTEATALYTINLQQKYTNELLAKYVPGASEYDAIEKASYDFVLSKLATTANKNAIKKALREIITAELGEEATTAEINAAVDERFTTEYIYDQIKTMYTAEKIEEERTKLIESTVKDRVEKSLAETLNSDEYKNELETLLSSTEFTNYINDEFESTSYYKYQLNYTKQIYEKVKAFCGEALDIFSNEIESAYNDFVEEYIEFITKSGIEYNNKSYNKTVFNKIIDQLYNKDDALKKILDKELKDAIIEDFREKEDRDPTGEELDAYVIDRGTPAYFREKALPHLSSSTINTMYNEQIEQFAKSKIGLEEIEAEEETKPAEGEEPAEEPEPEPEPEPDDEALTFYGLFFNHRIKIQYEKFNPTVSN